MLQVLRDASLIALVILLCVFCGFIYSLWPVRTRNRASGPPVEFSVWIADDVIYNRRSDGEVESVAISDLRKVLVETNDSGPWGYDVWFIFEDKQAHRVVFPLEAIGKDAVLDRLEELPGFEMRGMNSTDNATFECWPNPSQ